jgi:hypothetical protein
LSFRQKLDRGLARRLAARNRPTYAHLAVIPVRSQFASGPHDASPVVFSGKPTLRLSKETNAGRISTA